MSRSGKLKENQGKEETKVEEKQRRTISNKKAAIIILAVLVLIATCALAVFNGVEDRVQLASVDEVNKEQLLEYSGTYSLYCRSFAKQNIGNSAGDIDGDGFLTMTDYKVLKVFVKSGAENTEQSSLADLTEAYNYNYFGFNTVMENGTWSEAVLNVADIDGNGKINGIDVSQLEGYLKTNRFVSRLEGQQAKNVYVGQEIEFQALKLTGITGVGFEDAKGVSVSTINNSGIQITANNTSTGVFRIKGNRVGTYPIYIDGETVCEIDISQMTVTYNANRGIGAPSAQNKTYGSNITLSSTIPTRPGYTFKGWSKSQTATSATYQPGATYAENETATLYAVWEENHYTLTYNANGGTGAPSSVWCTYNEDITISLTIPTRTGHAFKGWSTSNTATIAEYKAGDEFSIYRDTTLYAVWEVTGSPKIKINSKEKKAGNTDNPYIYNTEGDKAEITAQNGYIGIQQDEDGSTNLSDIILPSESNTNYTIDSYGMYYVWAENSTNSTGTIHVLVTPELEINGCVYEQENDGGYSKDDPIYYRENVEISFYDGWKFDVEKYTTNWGSYCTNKNNFTIENDGLYRIVLKREEYEKGYVYICVDKTIPTVTVTPQDPYSILGSASDTNGSGIIGTQWSKSSTAPTSGWSNDHMIYSDDMSVGTWYFWAKDRAGNTNKASINIYSITYNANGGTGAPGAQKKIQNAPIALSSNIPTREGYDFLGWSTSSTATSATYKRGVQFSSNADTTLYAVWKKIEYTVLYDAKEGSGAPENQTKYHGEDLTLSSTIPTRSGYIFVNWETDSGDEYSPGDTYINDESVVLYAAWDETPTYTVTLNTNGGTINSGNITGYTYGVGATLPTDVTKTGYTLEGWYENSEFTGEAVTSIGTTESGNKTYYAKWTANKIKVTFEKNYGGGNSAIENFMSNIIVNYDNDYGIISRR